MMLAFLTDVSPVMVWSGQARHGGVSAACCGQAGNGGARADNSTEGLRAFPAVLARERSRRGTVRLNAFGRGGAWFGLAGRGTVRVAMAARRSLWVSLPPSRVVSASLGAVRFGEAGHGLAGLGTPWRGMARARRWHGGSHGSFPATLWGGHAWARPGAARCGTAGRVAAWHGEAWTGGARQGLISARRASALPAGFFGIQSRQALEWCGAVRHIAAGRVAARHGKPWHGMDRGLRPPTTNQMLHYTTAACTT